MKEYKLCNNCNLNKCLSEFRPRIDNGKHSYRGMCFDCEKEYSLNNKEKRKAYSKIYREGHKEQIKNEKQEYNQKNKEIIAIKQKEYRNKNKEKLLNKKKKYYINNKEEIIKKVSLRYDNNPKVKENRKKKRIKKYYQNKRKIDIPYKLRTNISKSVGKSLRRFLSSKNNKSVTKYLPYTFEELKVHLESLFGPWMNWNNYGMYNSKTWNDNDQTTWTWQIDHIIPQSLLPYDSMEHPNFIRSWSIDNLRPYSSKQNLLDGTTRIRHII
jgi:hypothetical protein